MEFNDPVSILQILRSSGESQQSIHEQAGRSRDTVFGQKVFIRGVVEVSNFCRQNCEYCGMRRDNKALDRYRISKDKLLEIILEHRPSSITDINIQAGEDPLAVREVVIPLVKEIRKHTTLGVSVCLGTLSDSLYAQLREAGAEYYILKLETGDEQHYSKLQAPGTLKKRLHVIRHLASMGWKVSSGMIVGLPYQTEQMLIETLQLLHELPLAGCSVSPFIAGNQTPLASYPDGNLELTLNALAAMRLRNPERVIPAVSAMGLVGKNGYSRALRSGANLATINLTPSDLRKNYLLYKQDRLIMDEQRVLSAIEEADCMPSETSLCDYLRASLVTR
jgi:biotin synthase